MAFSASSSSVSASPNVTPLIDVLLVLLIIFMVIVPVAPRGLSAFVPRPSASSDSPRPEPILVSVLPGAGGGVLYRMGAQNLDLPGLLRRLRQVSEGSAKPEIFIAGDKRLEYQPVAATIAAAHAAGFHVVGLLGQSEP